MGCIYRAKKHGKEYGNYLIAYRAHRRRVVESTHTTDYREAVTVLKLREGAVAEGKPIEPAGRKHAYTFEAATTAILDSYRHRNKLRTRRAVERRIARHLAPVFGGRRMNEITTTAIGRYIAERLDAKAARGQIKIELANLSRMFTLGVQAERIRWRPAFPEFTVDNARKGFFEPEQADAVIAHLDDPWGDLVTLACWMGWRLQAELSAMEWWQVDRDRRVIRLDPAHSKNGEGRTFPYGALPAVVAVIDRMHARREALKKTDVIVSRVFVTRARAAIATVYDKHGVVIRADFRREWKDACKLAGVAGRIPHDFRRTAVRNLVRSGVPEKTAMQLTGHKTRAVFDRYDIVNEADLTHAVMKYAAAQMRRPA